MTIRNILCRKKNLGGLSSSETSSKLSRVVGLKHLILLGLGSTIGIGVYILAGSAAHIAGPAVIISFFIAAVAATLSGLCYAEFAARLPKAGSAYTYTYVCIGEFVAFTIGWILIFEYLIGPASISRGVSSYLDSVLNATKTTTLEDAFSNVAYLGETAYWSSYFDFLAFGLPIVASVLLAFGLQESLILNMISTCINLLVVVFVIIAGATAVDERNWFGEAQQDRYYTFFPNDIIGMVKGAAICFFGFVGFDRIATTGEEVRRPQKMIPISIFVTLFIVFLVYFGISAVLTLMVSKFPQNEFAPLVYAFKSRNWLWPGSLWVIVIGALFGLSTSFLGAMFPLPQIIYAMALDGLLFPFLGSRSSQFKTPLVTTLISGLLTGVIAAIFDLAQLVEMMSLGTLIAYTIVAACVLLLRYRPNEENFNNNSYVNAKTTGHPSYTVKSAMKQLINIHCHKQPTQLTFSIIVVEIISFSILSLGMGIAVLALNENLKTRQPFAIAIVGIIGSFLILLLISMSSQPRVETHLQFQVPLVPLIPALSMFVNLCLMVMLSYETWIRFAVWMVVGYSIYFLYGTNHSRVENDASQESYNGRVISISRGSNEDYNMPTAPVHISIQAPTPSPSWQSLNSFSISKGLQNEESESSNTHKVHSENNVTTLAERKHEYLSHDDNTTKESAEHKKTELSMDIDSFVHDDNRMKESAEHKKSELSMDIDSFVDDAFSYFSSNSLRQEANKETSQDSILYSQNNSETHHNGFINENNFSLSQNESQEKKSITEEIPVEIVNKSVELNSESLGKDEVFNAENKETEASNKTLNRENLDEEKIGETNIFCEDKRDETNLDESVEYQPLHRQSMLDQKLSNGEKTSENNEDNGTASKKLASRINISVTVTSLSGDEINLDKNVSHNKTVLDKDVSNGEKLSLTNDNFTASRKVLGGENNIVGGGASPVKGMKPGKNLDNKKTLETVKPLSVDIGNNVNIKIQDFLNSRSIEENTNAKKVLNNAAPNDTYQKNNIEIISKPKTTNGNKDHAIVARRSSSFSSITESAKNSTSIKEVKPVIRNEQHELINTYTISNKPSVLSVNVVPINASTTIFQQKRYTASDKRKTIKIIQKTKARAPLPPTLKSEIKSAIPHEKNDSNLSRTVSVRNSEFNNKLNEILKTKLETGPQPMINSLKSVNSKSVNDLVNLAEINEQILLSSDYHKLPGNLPNNQKERQGTVFRSFNSKDRISGPALQNKEPTLNIVSTKEEKISPPFGNDNSEDTRKEIKKKLENLFTQKIKPVERPSIRPQVQSTEGTQEEFETMKRQRLLMGDVLASIKLVKNKNDSAVQDHLKKESNISSASEDEVFTRDNVSNSIIIQNKQTTAL